MFSTCIFCNNPLGRNEAIENFPVGERLAFDAARGRLWAVCRSCERWNLSPLDERWEAIEEAERLYRDTRKRVSTENIGLAKLRDGTTLVRIGEPQRPEFAAWRYGDQFGRRRTRAMWIAAGGIGVLGAAIVAPAVAGMSMGGLGYLYVQMGRRIIYGDPNSVVAKIKSHEGFMMHVRRRHLAESSIGKAEDGAMTLRLRYKNGESHFIGPEAERIASIVIPKLNRYGGNKQSVADAVQEIETLGSSEKFLAHLADVSHVYTKPITSAALSRGKLKRRQREFQKYGLYSLPAPYRLGLEMALHEEAERRAMQGEIAELERAWREAEEIAEIADNLLVPQSVEDQFKKMKSGV